MKCNQCKFWVLLSEIAQDEEEYGGLRGECRLNPPSLSYYEKKYNEIMFLFPETNDNSFCFKFEISKDSVEK